MTARFQSLVPGARLSDRVADALEAEIRAGRLAAGLKLPTETALAEQFAVSRTVVREEHEHIVRAIETGDPAGARAAATSR